MKEEKQAGADPAGLRELDARSRVVMETISDAVITIDEESTILFVNPAATEVFGYRAAEMLGQSLTMLMPEFMRRAHEAGLARYVETGERHISWRGVELPGLHESGREITLEVSFGESVDAAGRRLFTGVARDVTERKQAARLLAVQYELTRVIAEAPTTREAVSGVLHAVCERLGWALGALWVVDGGADLLRCDETCRAPSVGAPEFERMSESRTFARGEGLPGRVWEAGRPAWITNVVEDENFPRAAAAAREGLHGAFAFPVHAGGRAIGVMEFFSPEVREPDAWLLETMSSVGGQLGQIIERRRAEEQEARLREEIIRIQEAQLEELSTPLIPLADGLLVMPLIGAVDARRAQRMIDTLLRGVAGRAARFAVIDITGVPRVDAQVADTLVRAAQSARLLGTEVVLTGIRSGVASALVGLATDIEAVVTRKSLQDGIAYARARLGGG